MQHLSNIIPLPPSRVSVEAGVLKRTPANQALNPVATPQSFFTEGELSAAAPYVDDRAMIFKGDVVAELRRPIDSGI